MFAAGAKKVLIPSVPSITLDNPEQIHHVPHAAAQPHHIGMVAVHPMGSLRMGDNPKNAVVKSTGEHHQIARLFVLDGSIFPTSIGAPPQISIYSFAKHLSQHV